jgi:hypothetical protein
MLDGENTYCTKKKQHNGMMFTKVLSCYLVFVKETHRVLLEIETELLAIMQVSLMLDGVKQYQVLGLM